MKKTMKLLSAVIFSLGSCFSYAADDCGNCEDTNTCPPNPSGDAMSVELGE